MSIFTKALARVTTSLTQMRHAAQSLFFGGLLKRTRFDYAREVGDMLDASVVMAPIMWLQRALPEASLALKKRTAPGKAEPVDEHALRLPCRNRARCRGGPQILPALDRADGSPAG